MGAQNVALVPSFGQNFLYSVSLSCGVVVVNAFLFGQREILCLFFCRKKRKLRPRVTSSGCRTQYVQYHGLCKKLVRFHAANGEVLETALCQEN